MNSQRENGDKKLWCELCQKKFSCVSAKNTHMKNFHNKTAENSRHQHIRCPLCSKEQREPFGSYESLTKHLEQLHDVSINESTLYFRNLVEFETWRGLENREVDYMCNRRNKGSNGEEHIYYYCNRSNIKGYVSSCEKRSMKCGGSIRISGACPSKITVKVCKDGLVMVKYVETHVGHDDELRTKRLSKVQEEYIVGQLAAGVTKDRVLEDARIITDSKLERVNLITRGDLAYLTKKYNIDKQRDTDDMVATALKIEEWNREGKNHAFLFKQIGVSHSELKVEDFAVGYMNSVMEKKLKDFKRIICIDGTHGTNRRNWDLTTVLVRDEQNMGFPVAFLLSNRMDQAIQKIFFTALKTKLGQNIETEYIMTDDDPKYYNAWLQVMTTQDTIQKPRHLLCTWHIIKNWNIQGRSKIKKNENRQEMKKTMRSILKETNIQKFMTLKENYFNHLQEQDETEFLNYLQKYYFQSEERIMMWAHCYRLNAGINTNMAIESLNKVLKYNKMHGQRNIRVEKLLDLLEELVDDKMWKRIVNTERPNANSYQQKKNAEAHKKAESEMEDSLNSSEDDDVDALHIDEPTTSQSNYHGELHHYIEEKKEGRTFNQSLEDKRKILSAEMNDLTGFATTLEEESLDNLLGQLRKLKNNCQQRNSNTCRKRKIETQLYYPNKK